MFKSFFPDSNWFWLSVLIWAAICIFGWYQFSADLGAFLGLDLANEKIVIGLGHFVTDSFHLFYLYYAICIGIFAAFWFSYKPSKWLWWSIIGSAFILFSTYYSVQVSVAINNWRRPFFDAIQEALNPDSKASITATQLYDLLLIFAEIAFVYIFMYVVTKFIVSHFIFRWRTAMNDYYTSKWGELRQIEGA